MTRTGLSKVPTSTRRLPSSISSTHSAQTPMVCGIDDTWPTCWMSRAFAPLSNGGHTREPTTKTERRWLVRETDERGTRKLTHSQTWRLIQFLRIPPAMSASRSTISGWVWKRTGRRTYQVRVVIISVEDVRRLAWMAAGLRSGRKGCRARRVMVWRV